MILFLDIETNSTHSTIWCVVTQVGQTQEVHYGPSTLAPLIEHAEKVIPAFFFLAFWFILQFLNGTMSFSAQNAVSGGVAWWAHIGGFLAGIMLLFVFGVRRTTRRLRLYS